MKIDNHPPNPQEARRQLGDALDSLRKRTHPRVSLAACAQLAGVDPRTAGRWFRGTSAPQRKQTPGVRALVEHLQRVAGLTVGFDSAWRTRVEDAQRESRSVAGPSRSPEEEARADAANAVRSLRRFLDVELDAMCTFALSDDGAPSPYLWWQAPPEAHAKELLARLEKRLRTRPDIAVVSYDLVENRHHAPPDHFVAEVSQQLRRLPGGLEPVPEGTTPRQHLQKQFREVARRAARAGRRLVLVVHGLDEVAPARIDEDQGEGAASIAAQLPLVPARQPGKAVGGRPDWRDGIRVIVSSTPAARPLPDVPRDHPLRRRGCVRLVHSVDGRWRASVGEPDPEATRSGEAVGDVGEVGEAVRAAAHRDLASLRLWRGASRYFLLGLARFPGLLALAGDPSRARRLALEAPTDVLKATRLVEVATVLATSGPARGDECVREAVGRVSRARSAPFGQGEAEAHFEELANAVFALHALGRYESSAELLHHLVSCGALDWRQRIHSARLLDLRGGDRLARIAEHAADLSEGTPEERVQALGIRSELARATEDPRHLRDVEACCAEQAPDGGLAQVDLLALGASALSASLSASARELALRARTALLAAFAEAGALSPADRAHSGDELSTTLALVVRALSDVGAQDAAASLPDALPETLREDVLGEDRFAAPVGDRQDPADRDVEELRASLEYVETLLTKQPDRGREDLARLCTTWRARREAPDPHDWGRPLLWLFAVTGHHGDALLLAGCFPASGRYVSAPAAVAAGCAVGGHTGAVGELLERAVKGGGRADPAARGLIAQAYAHSGERDRAREWAEGGPGDAAPGQVERTWAAVAAGLARQDATAAVQLVEERLAKAPLPARLPGRRAVVLRRVAELLPVVPDPRLWGDEFRALFRDACAPVEGGLRAWGPDAVLILALLEASGSCPSTPVLRNQLHDWERYVAATPLPGKVLPVAQWAVLHSFRGDVRAARETAGRAATSRDRAAALAAVALHLAGVVPTVAAAEGWGAFDGPLSHFLALAGAVGRESHRDEAEARRLVQEVVSSGYWWYVLPLLPHWAPKAVSDLVESVRTRTRTG
ncbi:hypothetical protein ACWD6I_18340 [Streptomyces sp. NPDC002454]